MTPSLPLCLLFYLFLSPLPSLCTLLSSSTLEKCVNSEEAFTCEKKMVVSVAVEGDDNSLFSFSVDKVLDGETGQEKQLASPINISLSKTPPRIIFQLTRIATVNAEPYEVLIPRQLFIEGCDDDFTEDATCGVAKNPTTGALIANSQGYCCSCDLSTFFENRESRASHSCEQYGTGSSTASCMRFSPLWYDLSTFSAGVVDFTIEVDVKMKSGNDNIEEKLTLSPTSSTIATAVNISAKLVGDFSSFFEAPDFSNKIFSLPLSPSPSSPPLPTFLEEVLGLEGESGTGGAMMVERELVDLSGGVCNKIGVSYEAHQFQSQKCDNIQGSCFNNQLLDLYYEDKARQDQGQQTQYFLSTFGDFERTQDNVLSMLSPNDVPSLVVLTVVADNLQFIVSESTAVINSVSLNDFESGTKGEIVIELESTGTIAASFSLTILCTDEVVPINAQTIDLGPGEQETVTTDVFVGLATQDNEHSCNVSLLSSQGSRLDFKVVEFSTNAPDFDPGMTSPPPPPSDSGDDEDYGCDYCGFLAMECLYNYCRWQFSLLLLLFFSLFLLVVFFCYCFLCRGCIGCGGCCGRRRRRKRRRREREEGYWGYDDEGEERKGCCAWCCGCCGWCWGCLWGGCGKNKDKDKENNNGKGDGEQQQQPQQQQHLQQPYLYPPPYPYPTPFPAYPYPPPPAPTHHGEEGVGGGAGGGAGGGVVGGVGGKEVEEWVEREKMVYFNVPQVHKSDEKEFSFHPGPNFSILGVLKQEQNMEFSFIIPNEFRFQLKRFKKKKKGEKEGEEEGKEEGEERYRNIEKGTAPLSERFCQTKGMTLSDVNSYISSQPKFPVIN